MAHDDHSGVSVSPTYDVRSFTTSGSFWWLRGYAGLPCTIANGYPGWWATLFGQLVILCKLGWTSRVSNFTRPLNFNFPILIPRFSFTMIGSTGIH